jgi:hypothetical protein
VQFAILVSYDDNKTKANRRRTRQRKIEKRKQSKALTAVHVVVAPIAISRPFLQYYSVIYLASDAFFLRV